MVHFNNIYTTIPFTLSPDFTFCFDNQQKLQHRGMSTKELLMKPLVTNFMPHHFQVCFVALDSAVRSAGRNDPGHNYFRHHKVRPIMCAWLTVQTSLRWTLNQLHYCSTTFLFALHQKFPPMSHIFQHMLF